ncbi:hypothetical protein [uncultured Kordia sp.]|uniref:hypothetical protein n=1 Tax=uncultured Kordia sp. TaxID=507699 RepID=UPI002638263F|nr:hypothetical protein [uncultured Kordia sp.]
MKKTLPILLFVFFCITFTSCGSQKKAVSQTTTTADSGKKDGSSVENAIKVKSVPEEYAYVKKACQGCQLLGQALIFEDKKPYDVLKLKKPDGTEVSYYFDISSFYGKF